MKDQINQKYFQDIKKFPKQFEIDIEIKANTESKKYNNIYICGMGGSSLYVDIINNILALYPEVTVNLKAVRGYSIPLNATENDLFFVASYSGNTEETLNALDEIQEKKLEAVIVTSGGKLLERYESSSTPTSLIQIPTGLQPRLSTGYFISGIMRMLINLNLIPERVMNDIVAAAKEIADSDDTQIEEYARLLAQKLVSKVPVIYATDNNFSLAQVSKIKFNENAKTQAFWNYFPELNHNEMVGFSDLVMSPYFIIFSSKFTNKRNHQRMEIFLKLMKEKGADGEIINLNGTNVISEIFYGYYLADHISYYLAEEKGIDPEPVAMVEDFKAALS